MTRSTIARLRVIAWLTPGLLAAPAARPAHGQPPAAPAAAAAPAAPAAGKDSNSKRLEGAAMGLLPPGGLYGVEAPASDAAADGQEVKAETVAVPEVHVVKKGDTLWSLCEQYFKDPWRWPKLWASNPAITNPHWIFPGDSVRLRAPSEAAVAAAAPALPDAPTGMKITRAKGALGSNALVLRQVGFIEAKDLEASAVVSGSREEKIMLTTGDQIYLSFDKGKPLRAGERYSVFVADRDRPVRDPETHAVLGYLVRIYGDVVVDQVSAEGSGKGALVDCTDEIRRGFTVSPQVRQFRRVEPRPSNVTLDARIVASLTPVDLLATESFVVLSRGKKDGVEVGNRTFIVRRGDGYRGVLEGWDVFDPRFPKEVVGELLVVDVRERTSLAWISRTAKELRVGEVAEMRKGY